MHKLSLILLLLTVQLIYGQHIDEINFSYAVNESDLIIRVKVISHESKWINDETGKHIYTFADFNVIEFVKGFLTDNNINLKIIGGTVGDTTEYVSNSFLIRDNDEMILILSRTQDRLSYQILKKINIVDNKIFLNTKYVQVENFISFLKKTIDEKLILPDDPNEIEKRIDSFELNTKKIESAEIKSNHIQKTSSAQTNANLAPYKPLGWSAEVVASIVTGNNTDAASIKETDKLYIDWAVANFGPDDVNSSFLINLYVDDVLYAQWNVNGLPAGYYVYVTDYEIDPLASGNHTIKIKVDPTNLISELNEADNEYTKNIAVDAVAGLPTISNISPSSASAGTNTIITITGNNLGATRGSSKIEFYYRYGQPKIESTSYVSWSNTSIECEVPVGIINDYPASASSGPVTVTTNSGTSVGYNFTVTFSYGGVKWNGIPALVPLRINQNTNDLTGEGDEIIAAASSWTSAGSQFGFYYDGSTNLTDATYDGINEIMWGTTSGSLATAYYWYVGNDMIESDIVFNDAYNWSKDGSQFDVQSIALHELGHWLNLRDIYGGADSYKIMYGFSSSGVLKRNLTSVEVDGIKWIYGTGSSPLDAPLLSSPQNSSVNISRDPLLNWNKVIGSDVTYRLQVSTNQNFSSTLVDISNLTNNQYQLNSLSYNTTYYWRVSASNIANGSSGWSEVWSFTTIPQSITITCSSNPVQGGITTGCGTFTVGSQITLNAIPNSSYYFLNWTEGNNIVSTNANYSFTVSSDRTLTANFDLIPIITITQPNGGEVWQEASQHEIKWTSTNVQNVKIEYSTNNGQTWNIITNSVSASLGKIDWTLPNSPTLLAKIRISDSSNDTTNDISDNVFTISPIPTLTLMQPNGGESWQRSSQQEIKWTSAGVQNIKIEFSTNNGTDWQTIIESTPASVGKYDWTLPNIPTQQAMVRISESGSATLNDVSDNVFTIGPIPAIILTSPNGGESWLVGTPNSIRWTHENISNIKIGYTTDDGDNWLTIVNSTPAHVGIYNWLIPKMNSAQAKIRISDTDNFTYDTSNNTFNITGVTRGDVNENGEINGIDAALILRNVVGLTNLTTRQQYAADANLDNTVQAYDAYCILYYVLNGTWPQ